jgi:chromosome segregation ATPase
MRKTFLTGFKAFCVGAMALAAVSCYDDSALRAEIDSLDERLTKVEKDLNEDIKNLSDLQATVANLETSLRKAIADGDAAVQKALEDKLTALEAKLNKAIQDGDKALADQLAAEKKTLTETLAALQAGLTSVTSSVEALQQTLTALEATVNSNYQTLLGKLDAADGVVDGYVKDITAAIAALQQADKDINAALLEAIAKISVVKVAEVDGKIVGKVSLVAESTINNNDKRGFFERLFSKIFG